jgi:hypothetical protein
LVSIFILKGVKIIYDILRDICNIKLSAWCPAVICMSEMWITEFLLKVQSSALCHCVVLRQSSVLEEQWHSLSPASVGFLLGLLFDHEDGSCVFLWNIRISPGYMALQPRIPNSLCCLLRGLKIQQNFCPT